ncbi:hypothetical protein D6D05_02965 [Aureobasidium pullulans]|nr:hypothetical protein D6D05_02965 [Aureobasidium pullulans]
MISSIFLPLAFAVCQVSSSPIHQRRALSQNDIIGLQLAGYLENLELSLYTGGCEGFTDVEWIAAGFPSTFQQDICAIAEACSYNLSYDSPTSFVLLANQITSISLGFYLGSLNDFSPALQTVAASILSVEARHDAIVRNGMGASPFPTNLDVPLSSVWAYSLAQKYISSCPRQLPIDLLPPLGFNGMSGSTPTEAGQALYLAIVHANATDPSYQQVLTTGQGQGTAQLPEGLGGVVYAALTASSGDLTFHELTTTGTLAGPAQLVLS